MGGGGRPWDKVLLGKVVEQVGSKGVVRCCASREHLLSTSSPDLALTFSSPAGLI